MAGEDIIGFVILAIVGVVFGTVLAYASRYKKVPPNMAMVVYGRRQKGLGGRGYQVKSGGAKFIVPIFESVEWLRLDVRTLDLVVTDIVTDVKRSGAKINIKAVAQVKISSDEATLNTAAENLLGKTEQQVDEIALKTLEGHVRGVCATLTVEEVNSDRDAIASKILGMAGNDLRNMGIEIRSFVIKEIEDAQGYLDALGVKRTEEVKRDARMGKAGANREATIAEAQAAQEAERANASAEANVAQFHRDRDIIKQQSETQVELERANKEIAFQLQTAKRQQELIVEQRKIDIRAKEQEVRPAAGSQAPGTRARGRAGRARQDGGGCRGGHGGRRKAEADHHGGGGERASHPRGGGGKGTPLPNRRGGSRTHPAGRDRRGGHHPAQGGGPGLCDQGDRPRRSRGDAREGGGLGAVRSSRGDAAHRREAPRDRRERREVPRDDPEAHHHGRTRAVATRRQRGGHRRDRAGSSEGLDRDGSLRARGQAEGHREVRER